MVVHSIVEVILGGTRNIIKVRVKNSNHNLVPFNHEKSLRNCLIFVYVGHYFSVLALFCLVKQSFLGANKTIHNVRLNGHVLLHYF